MSESSLLKNVTIFTPLLRAKNIERIIGTSFKIFLKWEGNNITHTHKDRAARFHVVKAIKEGYKEIAVATCGNFGVSLAYFSKINGVGLHVFIPRRYTNSRLKELIRYGAEIKFIDGSYEDAVAQCNTYTSLNNIYNANPGVNSLPSIIGYKEIAYEIISQLNEIPYSVVIPVGNGTTLVGIYEGFRELYKNGIIERVPKIIATSTKYGNQIVESWQRGGSLVKLSSNDIVETEYNEPLVSYRSFDGEKALNAIKENNGLAYSFADDEMLKASNLLKYFEGVTAIPASASTLAGFLEFLRHNRDIDGSIVLVITGGNYTWRTH